MRTKRLVLIAVIAIIGWAVGTLPSAADHGGPHVELLARGAFVDDVAAMFRVKVDDGRTFVHQAHDASDVVVAKITIPDGAQIGWHAHTGPVLGVNAGPGTVTSFHADNCVLQEFPQGTVIFDRGQQSAHGVVNNSGQEAVVYATFLGVQGGPLVPTDPPADCGLLP